MARGINKVTIVGNLGKDPETNALPSGNYVTNISVATSESWKDKKTGQQKERTEWHRIVFFSRLAEIAGEYLKKGSQVYIEGKLQTRKWQDQNGQDRYTTEIVANEMQMLGGRAAEPLQNSSGHQVDFHHPPPQAARQKLSNNTDPHGRPIYEPEYQGKDSFDDDIPF